MVLDEVHEALDHEFRQIVADRAHASLEAGGIVVAAGHDHPLLATFCDRALWLADGRIAADGPFEEIRQAYLGEASSVS
jgi:ABC-type polysaccharide/polyol phosphate transport system ATPase subunit